MPADTKASHYIWLMDGVPEQKAIVRFRWDPKGGRITSSLGEGTLVLEEREILDPEVLEKTDPQEGWVRNPTVAPMDMPWVVAQNFVRSSRNCPAHAGDA